MDELQRQYTRHDYAETSAPYEELYSVRDDPFEHQRKLDTMAEAARLAGYKTFKKTYEAYVKSIRQVSSTIWVGSLTDFEDQPLTLDSGMWRADEMGVTMRSGFDDVVACVHPIMPVGRLVNVDTGMEKLDIAFRKAKQWRHVIVDKSVLASATAIISLAGNGIAVTSESAKYLVKYLHDIENLNYETIPEKSSVSRLGYIDGEGFSPYVDGLIFDGDANFRTLFNSVKSAGSRDAWLQTARTVRADSIAARLVVAASFASVLVHPLGGLPFFVHLWGSESGTGKTVALMVATSVWACPEVGKYIQTFNSTVVGHERLAAFLNSLPVVIDELQLAKDDRGRLKFNVYALAEGVGKSRGTRSGGIDKTPTWSNCIITCGESPITQESSGAGAINRVIEIECRANDKIVKDGHGVAGSVKRNYGFAGREFVDRLHENGQLDRARELYSAAFRELSANDTTEKQAMAAAMILVADTLATEWIFQDGGSLTVSDIACFLQSKASVNVNQRAYAYLCDWVTQNANKFRSADSETAATAATETYGVIDGDCAYIIRSVFIKAAEDAGYSSAALLSWLKQAGLIQCRGRKSTLGKRINGVLTECVVMKVGQDEDECPF